MKKKWMKDLVMSTGMMLFKPVTQGETNKNKMKEEYNA